MESSQYSTIAEMEKTNWWYRSRRDLLNRLLKDLEQPFNRVLDLGCGTGSNAEVLSQYADHLDGVDIAEEALSYCGRPLYDEVTISHVLDFNPPHRYDLIVSLDVLEHCDDTKVVEKVHTLLKDGGCFIFSVPAFTCLWNDNDDISQHVRRYRKRDLKELFESGFDVSTLSYWNMVLFLPAYFLYKVRALDPKREKQNNLNLVPTRLNSLLSGFLRVENYFFSKKGLPFGVSLFGVAQKRISKS